MSDDGVTCRPGCACGDPTLCGTADPDEVRMVRVPLPRLTPLDPYEYVWRPWRPQPTEEA